MAQCEDTVESYCAAIVLSHHNYCCGPHAEPERLCHAASFCLSLALSRHVSVVLGRKAWPYSPTRCIWVGRPHYLLCHPAFLLVLVVIGPRRLVVCVCPLARDPA